MSRRTATITALLTVTLAACGDGGTAPAAALLPEGAMLARPGGPSDPAATFLVPLADAALGVRSDGRYSDGTNSVYANGVCGVSSKIFATTQYSNSGDATMQTNKPSAKDRNCSAARTMTVDFGNGVQSNGAVFVNVRQIANTTYSIPIGSTVSRTLGIAEDRCSGLRWVPVLNDGTVTGADEVLVTRVDASTWRVQSRPYPNNKAYCLGDGQLYNIAVDFTVLSSYPLP